MKRDSIIVDIKTDFRRYRHETNATKLERLYTDAVQAIEYMGRFASFKPSNTKWEYTMRGKDATMPTTPTSSS